MPSVMALPVQKMSGRVAEANVAVRGSSTWPSVSSSAAAMEEMPHSSISAIRNERTRLVMVFSSFDFFKNRISCF